MLDDFSLKVPTFSLRKYSSLMTAASSGSAACFGCSYFTGSGFFAYTGFSVCLGAA
jgi:hypothetical protein